MKEAVEKLIEQYRKANTFGPGTKNFSKVTYTSPDNHIMIPLSELNKLLNQIK